MSRAALLVFAWALFACGGDGGPMPPTEEEVLVQSCDTQSQTGCPPSYKCTMYQHARFIQHACVKMHGALPEAETACSSSALGVDDCGRGLICSEESDGICWRLCREVGGCGQGRSCFQQFTLDDGICRDSGCDVFDPETCTNGRTCDADALVGLAGVGTYCRSAGESQVGAACQRANDCVARTSCVLTSPNGGVCRAFCDQTHRCSSGTCVFSALDPSFGSCL